MTGTYKNWTTDVVVTVHGITEQVYRKKNADGLIIEEKLKHVIYTRDGSKWRIAKPLYVFNRTYLKI